MNVFKVGADPELFATQDGQYISAHNLIPGSKAAPYPVENGAVQVDGMALEFNINPAESEDGFVFNLQSVMAQLRDMVPGFNVVAHPVARFTEEYMSQQPEVALELGCDPDYNAWTSTVNEKPDNKKPIRTGAGHVHIGWGDGMDTNNSDHVQFGETVVKQMDFYLGLPSLLFDKDEERRSMYGQAGAYRAKPYGVEYRVLSNKWLAKERHMRWVFNNVQRGMNALKNGPLHEEYGDIQGIINNSHIEEAQRIIQHARIPVPLEVV